MIVIPRYLVVVGGGEHGRVVMEAAQALPKAWRVLGFVDPRPCDPTAALTGFPRLGDDCECPRLGVEQDAWFLLGVGALEDAGIRAQIASRLDKSGIRWAALVHPEAWVSPSAVLEPGVFVGAGAVVQSGARIGRHAIVNTGAVVEHDVRIGAFSHLGPAAAIGGGVQIGERCRLGLGCRVRDHVCLGDGVVVGMGAVVVDDVKGELTVVGIPARPVARI